MHLDPSIMERRLEMQLLSRILEKEGEESLLAHKVARDEARRLRYLALRVTEHLRDAYDMLDRELLGACRDSDTITIVLTLEDPFGGNIVGELQRWEGLSKRQIIAWDRDRNSALSESKN